MSYQPPNRQVLKPPAEEWLCRDCGQIKLASEFPHWRPGRPSSPCKTCRLKRVLDYQHANPEIFREKSKQNRIKYKRLVIEAYGGRCACCHEDDLSFLSIDHERNDGKAHRESLKSFQYLYHDLRKRDYPQGEGLRVLCYNCNFGRRAFTCCPHAFVPGMILPYRGDSPSYQLKYQRTKGLILRREMVEAYGSKCVCCGEENLFFLTIDHIRGDGAKHRRNNPSHQGLGLYRFLKSEGFPKDHFQLLCYNCNTGKGTGDRCPHQKDAENVIIV